MVSLISFLVKIILKKKILWAGENYKIDTILSIFYLFLSNSLQNFKKFILWYLDYII